MAAGIGALQSALGLLKKRLPNRNKKVSVVFYDPFTDEIDWPPEEKLNKNGVLLIPLIFEDGVEGELQWELFCTYENQKVVS